MAQAKAGPVVSDNGNFIIDVDFGKIENPKELNLILLQIPGVVDTGLFVNMASKAYIGQKDGTVEILN
jgi:ribose 5-phosphate isomerase A